MKSVFLLALMLLTAGVCISMVGCGSGDYPANYSHEVKKSDADKAREAELMKGQKMPGTAKR